MALTTLSLLVPAAFSASTPDDQEDKEGLLRLSHGVSIVLLIVYVLYLLFQVSFCLLFGVTTSSLLIFQFYNTIAQDTYFLGSV